MINEWRVPLTILLFSSMIFTGVTLLIGVSVNRMTGETELEMMLSLKDDDYKDPWVYDPMLVVWGEFWRYWALIGYYGALAVFSYAWFEFMKQEKEQKRKDMKHLGLTRVRPRDIENAPFFSSNYYNDNPKKKR